MEGPFKAGAMGIFQVVLHSAGQKLGPKELLEGSLGCG